MHQRQAVMRHPQTATVFPLCLEDQQVIAVLVVDDEYGDSRIVPEVLHQMRTLLSSGESFDKMRSIANTLAWLNDYVVLKLKNEPLCSERLPEVVSDFLRRRRFGSSDGDSLGWLPVQRETVRRDRDNLIEVSEYCASRLGYFPLVSDSNSLPVRFESGSQQAFTQTLKRVKGGLLAHLAQDRKSKPHGRPKLKGEKSFPKPVSRGKRNISISQIEDLIESTPSVVQRMAFIHAAFGGPRASEILNTWRCDVLPGLYRPLLFPDDKKSDVPLLVIAHPSSGKYVGNTKLGSTDRLQHLFINYGLKPRIFLDANPNKAGFKGILYDNSDLEIAQIYWSDRRWARIYYGLFQKLRDEVLPQIPENIRCSHPYLYINDCPSRKEFGRPMKMSNLRKAFARACKRVNIDALGFDYLHVLRHGYKSRLERMGLSKEEIRVAMHHVSEDSQKVYGDSSGKLNEKLTKILGK